MSNNNVKATAPYNFIPFSNKVLEYDGMLPEHGKIYKGLKSGEIHIKVTADTDLMIAGRKDADNVCRFYKNNDGKFAIPGSSLRGLIRRNMQILGFGYFDVNEHFEDYQIFYRAMASKSNSVEKELDDYYKSLLGVKTGNKNGKSFSNPENVKAGYIKKENGGYVIYPAKDGYIRINRNSEILDKFKPAKSDDEYARVVSVLYKGSDDKNLVLKSDRDADSDALRNGKLLYTGKSVGNKPNAVYLFTEIDEDSQNVVYVSDEDIQSYLIDYETRKNILKSTFGDRHEFWNIPQKVSDEPKPVFYLNAEGHTFFGMTLFLRVGYKYALSRGIPKIHRDYSNMSEEEKPLDYIRALFGYADKAGAYRSRISFGDCSAEGNVKEQKRVSLTLAGPKPSYYKNYVVEGKHYNKDDFKLRGYKQYWFKKDIEEENSNIKENVATKIAPLPAGTVFSGVIRFKNLSETELGLLLWCIRLNDKGFHGIGMAKPYGYGRVKMEVEELKVLNMDKLYDLDSLESDPFETFNDDIQRKYIEEYKKYASKNIKSQNKSDKKNKSNKVDEEASIKQFIFMSENILENNECRYLELSEYKPLREAGKAGILPDVNEYMESKKTEAVTTEENMDDRLKMLQQMFNKR